jgi:hypothetical protein
MASTWSGAPIQIASSIPRTAAEGAEGSILLRQGPGFRARWRFVVITADQHLIDSGSQLLSLVSQPRRSSPAIPPAGYEWINGLRWKAGNARMQTVSHHGWDQNETDFGDAYCWSVGLEAFP